MNPESTIAPLADWITVCIPLKEDPLETDPTVMEASAWVFFVVELVAAALDVET